MSEPSAPQSLDFDDLSPRSVNFKYKGGRYVLHEASEGASVIWRDAVLKATKFVDGKVVGVENLAATEPLLVSLCLFEKLPSANGQEQEKPVPLPTVRAWEGRIIQRIFEKAKLISELDDKPDQEKLEKQFAETAAALVSLSESSRDRQQWDEWMRGVVAEKVAVVAGVGPAAVQEGNGQDGTEGSSS